LSYVGMGGALGSDCPGAEVFDQTIGACTCPKGYVTTMVAGECQLDKGADTTFKKTAGACHDPAQCPEDWTKKGQTGVPWCPSGPEEEWPWSMAEIQKKYGGCVCRGSTHWSEAERRCVGPAGSHTTAGAPPPPDTAKAGMSLSTGAKWGLAVGGLILLGAWAWEPAPARSPLR